MTWSHPYHHITILLSIPWLQEIVWEGQCVRLMISAVLHWTAPISPMQYTLQYWRIQCILHKTILTAIQLKTIIVYTVQCNCIVQRSRPISASWLCACLYLKSLFLYFCNTICNAIQYNTIQMKIHIVAKWAHFPSLIVWSLMLFYLLLLDNDHSATEAIYLYLYLYLYLW